MEERKETIPQIMHEICARNNGATGEEEGKNQVKEGKHQRCLKVLEGFRHIYIYGENYIFGPPSKSFICKLTQ